MAFYEYVREHIIRKHVSQNFVSLYGYYLCKNSCINFDNIKIGNVKPMNEWCESNCRGLWRSETYHALYWQFEDEQDATMFMLRWAQAEGNRIK